MSTPTIVSLFAGAGGLDLGFVQEGFAIKLALDSDPAAVAVHNANLGQHAKKLDVRDHSFTRELEDVRSCDLLLGGFPCQGFSKAGPKKVDDTRNVLYRSMITAMEVLRPAMFVAENVDGLSQNYNGQVLAQIVRDCEQAGYVVEWRIVDASWFGVPQHRRRILIVGTRADLSTHMSFVWPSAQHTPLKRNGERHLAEAYPNWAPALHPPRTLRVALTGANKMVDHVIENAPNEKIFTLLSRIGPGQKLCNARHDLTSVKTWDVPTVFGEVSLKERRILEIIARNRRHKKYGNIPNGNPLSRATIESLLTEPVTDLELSSLEERKYLKRVDDRWDLRGAMFASGSYKRPLLDQPSPTVLTSFNNPRFMAHPVENRPFTVREVARIQTFPDDYRFLLTGVTIADAYRLIGNAVPPLLARLVARSALDAFSSLQSIRAA